MTSRRSKLSRLAGLSVLSVCFAGAGRAADDAAVEAAARPPSAGAHRGMNADVAVLDEALWSAAAGGDLKRVERLLEKGAGAAPPGAAAPTSPLWIASQEGHIEIVRLLLALGTNVEAEHPADGRTALFQAAQQGHADIVALLLDRGARVDARSARTGATPLFIAAARGHMDVVRQLLAAGADVNVEATANGIADSPFSIAGKRGFPAIADLIARSGGAAARQ